MESKTSNVLIATMMLAVILLVWTRGAQAALVATEQAYELTVDQVERWPLSDNGRIVLRACATCETVALSVDANTTYRSSQSSLNITREEMLQIKSMLGNPDDAFLYIFYRPDDDIATRIVLDTGN